MKKFKESLSKLIAETGTGYLPKPQFMLIDEIVSELKEHGHEVKVEEGINGKMGYTFTLI